MPEVLEPQVSASDCMGAILAITQCLTLYEALRLLTSLDKIYVDETVYRDDRDAKAIPFSTLGRDPRNLCKSIAHIGPLWFWGGPPGHKGMTCGMASQYVADCLLQYMDGQGSYRHLSLKINSALIQEHHNARLARRQNEAKL